MKLITPSVGWGAKASSKHTAVAGNVRRKTHVGVQLALTTRSYTRSVFVGHSLKRLISINDNDIKSPQRDNMAKLWWNRFRVRFRTHQSHSRPLLPSEGSFEWSHESTRNISRSDLCSLLRLYEILGARERYSIKANQSLLRTNGSYEIDGFGWSPTGY